MDHQPADGVGADHVPDVGVPPRLRRDQGENREMRSGKPFTRRFKEDKQHLCWSLFQHSCSDHILPLMREPAFPHLCSTVASGTAFAELLKDAPLMFQKPGLPANAVNMIHELPLPEGDTH
ncbi:MAG: hypothetical protein HRT62_00025 [Epibacterium sp.]|nr:hypothetical protein [Epibacterium sp.]